MCKLAITIILLFYLIEVRGYPQTGKTIHAKAGSVEGTVSRSRLRREFYSWLGIPYAKPPVGYLRFAVSADILYFCWRCQRFGSHFNSRQSPQPLEKWEGVLQARHYGPRCAQYDGFQELYLGREVLEAFGWRSVSSYQWYLCLNYEPIERFVLGLLDT